MTTEEIIQIAKNSFALFPIGCKVRVKGNSCGPHVSPNEEGIVTAHGCSVQSGRNLIGIKVPGELGSALLYNREACAASLDLINL